MPRQNNQHGNRQRNRNNNVQNQADVQVSAPYNFVPLNEKVFFPPWAGLVNNDVPFKEGLSGKIKLKITAKTPIFIRKPYEDGDEYYEQERDGETVRISKEFCHIKDEKGNKKYYIPGSSLKGEIRNVLEIMSFSKLSIFNDVKYSQREFYNNQLYDKGKFANVKGGWLSKHGDKYIIEYSNDKPGRISFEELKNIYGIDFEHLFGIGFHNDDYYKTAHKKYNLVSGKPLNYTFSCTVTRDGRQLYKKSTSGKNGTIVFTGQPSPRKQARNKKTRELIFKPDGSPVITGKWLEFIFWKSNQSVGLDENDLRIKNFKTAYHDSEPGNESLDWRYFKQKLNNGEKIPIFITVNNGEIEHFGLSMLYKQPYNYSIGDILGEKHLNMEKDLAETIFGYINEKSKNEEKLKGRVSFKHAFATNVNESEKEYTTVLSSPKPTYYPFYIKQNLNNENTITTDSYLTYNDGTIAGRKLYPVRDEINIINLDPSSITTTFKPLDKGSEFDAEVIFHNLLPEELGALLSAITFHGNSDKFRHSIGMAKPYGFGSIKIKVNELEIDKKDADINLENLMCVFEKLMKKEIGNDWLETEQIKELLALKYPVTLTQENKSWFEYLELSIQPKKNEFEDLKKDKKGLPRYSHFMNLDDGITKINSMKDNNCALSKAKLNLKQYLLQLFERKITEINKKERILHQKDLAQQGICAKLKNFNGKYGDLKSIIENFAQETGIREVPYFSDEKQVNCIMDALQIAKSNLKGKKKKLFKNDERKKDVIKLWIGEDKTNVIFNNQN